MSDTMGYFVDSGELPLMSSGYWAPTALHRSASDPLAGVRHVSSSMRRLLYVRKAVPPVEVEVVPALEMRFPDAVRRGQAMIASTAADLADVELTTD